MKWYYESDTIMSNGNNMRLVIANQFFEYLEDSLKGITFPLNLSKSNMEDDDMIQNIHNVLIPPAIENALTKTKKDKHE
jgi:hypothetical protein